MGDSPKKRVDVQTMVPTNLSSFCCIFFPQAVCSALEQVIFGFYKDIDDRNAMSMHM